MGNAKLRGVPGGFNRRMDVFDGEDALVAGVSFGRTGALR